MQSFALLPKEERRIAFEEASYTLDIAPVVLEKDFWVCWILDKVFSRSDPRPGLLFKGGTSLSKVFGLIRRFSEDVDLSLDRADFGFSDARDPINQSGNARKRLLAELTDTANRYVSGHLFETLRGGIEADIGPTGEAWGLEVSAEAADILIFTYPGALDETPKAYIKPAIRLELGARSDHFPIIEGIVQPYVFQEFPEHFVRPEVPVRALDAKRTFWEKATILHSLANGGLEQVRKGRRSRHYYDLYELARSDVRDAALEDIGLLQVVARHKQVFFYSAWAHYETAKVGTLRLVPDKEIVSELERDYRASASMFFGAPPSFEEILDGLKELEHEIDSLSDDLEPRADDQ